MAERSRTDVQTHDWDRLLVEFLNAEIDHGMAALAPDQITADAMELQQRLRDALDTLEFARQFEPGIADPVIRKAIHTRADELAHRARRRKFSDAA